MSLTCRMYVLFPPILGPALHDIRALAMKRTPARLTDDEEFTFT
jgi:hypothetical protein